MHQPATQRCKWVAIDADYENALNDLIKLGYYLEQDAWNQRLRIAIVAGTLDLPGGPLPARDCGFMCRLACGWGCVKGGGLREGIEVFQSTMS